MCRQLFIIDLVNYGLREKYEQLRKHRNRLDDMRRIIDWESPETTAKGPIHQRHRSGWETELRLDNDCQDTLSPEHKQNS
jgi:hypothetical protein